MTASAVVRTRFAPSPTGDLHVGGAWTALASWVVARRAGGKCVLRVEDVDRPRVVPGAAERIAEDLRWLGLDWDEGPIFQSDRDALYEQALAALAARGLVYPCDCSRADVARAASAPHEGEDVVYPGTCRGLDPARRMKRPPAMRVRVPDEVVEHRDEAAGTVAHDLGREVGDFVLRRGDGAFAYQLAVVVDDHDMGITHVVRGADLLRSTPRQMWLARALGVDPPAYLHVALVVARDGGRLQKRTRGLTIRELRAAGFDAPEIVGRLAHGLGLTSTPAPAAAAEIAASVAGRSIPWRREPWAATFDVERAADDGPP